MRKRKEILDELHFESAKANELKLELMLDVRQLLREICDNTRREKKGESG